MRRAGRPVKCGVREPVVPAPRAPGSCLRHDASRRRHEDSSPDLQRGGSRGQEQLALEGGDPSGIRPPVRCPRAGPPRVCAAR